MIIIESIDHIGLTVSNLDNSIEFYKELFDFELIHSISNSNNAFIRVGDILIGLTEDEDYKCQNGSNNRICFFIDEEDFEDALEELEERGIPISYGPENIRKGKLVVFCDPDGNQIQLSYPKMNI